MLEAFATVAISYSLVRAMTRVATNGNEEQLSMIAKHGTASQMEQLVRKHQRIANLNTPEQEQHQTRELLYC